MWKLSSMKKLISLKSSKCYYYVKKVTVILLEIIFTMKNLAFFKIDTLLRTWKKLSLNKDNEQFSKLKAILYQIKQKLLQYYTPYILNYLRHFSDNFDYSQIIHGSMWCAPSHIFKIII